MAKIYIFILPVLMVLTSCQSDHNTSTTSAAHQLGAVNLKVSGAPEALPDFEKGLLLLHSFEYEDARAAFQKAQEVDADFAMAYWGEAMTYNQPIWHRQQQAKARATMQRLGGTLDKQLSKAGTALEKDFIKSLDVLYGEGEKEDRDLAYADFMSSLYEKYPDNQEVAAFYALSLLGSVQAGRDVAVFEKGAGIAQSIIRENPEHPGALHYLIHSYDDPNHARLAIDAANRYAKVAPDATHALHMPSHIYVAMGMWEEVVNSNIASYEASIKRMKAKDLDNDARSYHAFHWLQYGYLQKGSVEEAEDILSQMVGYTQELPSVTARSYLVRMLGNFLVETGNWDHPLAATEVDLNDLNISHQAVGYFLKGYQAYRQEDEAGLAALIDTLADKRQQASMIMATGGAPMCSTSSAWGSANKVEVKQAEVMEIELKALLWRLRGDEKKAEKFMVRAVNTQHRIDYSYGPPEVVYPAYEFYADFLMEKKSYTEALKMYEMAQERGPGRTLAVNGELKAKEQLSSVQ
ncbi:MAG: hypothetical protein RIC19_12695 [Phaeodactylibacter sp.]|uniref:tetratricopeptide repeat protein n=1 Tax=Phaeodactylibacter sp. TaxID=1940289 RepID=UPI0032ECD82A